MDLERIKNFIEFKKDYVFIANMQWKFNYVRAYRNMIVLLDPNKEESNIAGIVNEIKKIGYELKDVKNYNDLYIALSKILSFINSQVNEYMSKKIFDKITEKAVRNMFDVEIEKK